MEDKYKDQIEAAFSAFCVYKKDLKPLLDCLHDVFLKGAEAGIKLAESNPGNRNNTERIPLNTYTAAKERRKPASNSVSCPNIAKDIPKQGNGVRNKAIATRVCSRCGKEWPLSMFRDQYNSVMKVCKQCRDGDF